MAAIPSWMPSPSTGSAMPEAASRPGDSSDTPAADMILGYEPLHGPMCMGLVDIISAAAAALPNLRQQM